MNALKKLFQFLNNQSFVSLEEKIMGFFKTLPQLPAGIVDFIVSFGPYLALIGGILSVLSLLSVLSIGGAFLPYITPFLPAFYISIAGSVIAGIMLIASFEDLKNKKLFGWKLVFWSANVGILTSLLSLNLLGAVIGALINWYILSQIKPKYS